MNATAASFTAGHVDVSAILENGSATTIIINDKTNAVDGSGGHQDQNYEYTPVVTQRGTFLDVKANTNNGAGMEVYTGAWNWLVDNGYSVICAQKDTTGAIQNHYWTFFVSKNGQSTFFQTDLTVMVRAIVDGVVGFYEDGKAVDMAGDYWDYQLVSRSASAPTRAVTGSAIQSGSTDFMPSYATHDNGTSALYIWTNLCKVDVDSNGASGGATPYYYKMGETIALKGNWYNVNLGTQYASTKNVTMTNSLRNAVIYDNYYHVTISDSVSTYDKYIISGNSTTSSGLTGNNWYKTDDGKFIQASSGELTVTEDISISDKTTTYFRVTVPNDQSPANVIDSTNGQYTYTITTTGERVGNAIYVKSSDKITVSVTYVSGAIGGVTGDTITVTCAAGIPGAAVVFTDSSVATTATQTIEVNAFTKDGSLSITGNNA